jgi:pimeloyl-ACP methyl ester carboxylesterase
MKDRKTKDIVKNTLLILMVTLLLFLIIQFIRCSVAVKKGYGKLDTYDASITTLSYGAMTYVDRGEGETILSIHGIFGGYDQGFDTCKDLVEKYRIIAPSRFGYLGSDILGDGTPKEQAKAYVELLDQLGIEKVYLLATSAGGTVAIRFALDYPERTKGLILYCSAMPLPKKPNNIIEYQGPPEFLCNNFGMWLISPFFEPIMGMTSDTVYSMLPINERSTGVKIDASITNPDMARNYDEYAIETLQRPTLILCAKDDKMVNYENVVKVVDRFPNCTFIAFEHGGHLMTGNQDAIETALHDFISQ